MVLRGIATSIHAVPRSGYTHPTLRSFAYIQRRRITSDNAFFRISEEVREAIHSKKPVVALETTIYTHGALLLQIIVREQPNDRTRVSISRKCRISI